MNTGDTQTTVRVENVHVIVKETSNKYDEQTFDVFKTKMEDDVFEYNNNTLETPRQLFKTTLGVVVDDTEEETISKNQQISTEIRTKPEDIVLFSKTLDNLVHNLINTSMKLALREIATVDETISKNQQISIEIKTKPEDIVLFSKTLDNLAQNIIDTSMKLALREIATVDETISKNQQISIEIKTKPEDIVLFSKTLDNLAQNIIDTSMKLALREIATDRLKYKNLGLNHDSCFSGRFVDDIIQCGMKEAILVLKKEKYAK